MLDTIEQNTKVVPERKGVDTILKQIFIMLDLLAYAELIYLAESPVFREEIIQTCSTLGEDYLYSLISKSSFLLRPRVFYIKDTEESGSDEELETDKRQEFFMFDKEYERFIEVQQSLLNPQNLVYINSAEPDHLYVQMFLKFTGIVPFDSFAELTSYFTPTEIKALDIAPTP